MTEENKTKKGTMGVCNRLEELEERAQDAHARVHEVKNLLRMLELIHTEASSGNEVDQVAVIDVITRCADQAIAVIEEIEKLGADFKRKNDVAQRRC